MNAEEIIEKLQLVPLPEEGGYYRETYRSEGVIPDGVIAGSKGVRNFSTQIYYLVTPDEFSALHRVKTSDEIFHFYLGDPVEMVQITEKGEMSTHVLGQKIPEYNLQVVAPRGVWQGTRLIEGGNWALLGCSVAPGFEFSDFEVKTRSEFIDLFPQHKSAVERYTR